MWCVLAVRIMSTAQVFEAYKSGQSVKYLRQTHKHDIVTMERKLSGSNTDGSFTTAVSNSCLSPQKKIP